ncbi:hypothetical protein ACWEN3_28705 [Streptomyces sp. NPDC004561]
MSDTKRAGRQDAAADAWGPRPGFASRHPLGLRVMASAVLGAFGLFAVPVVLLGGVIMLEVVGRALNPPPIPEDGAVVLRKRAVVGTWRDDRGGRMVVGADGTFTWNGVCGDFSDADLNSVATPDSGSGTWHRSNQPAEEEDSSVTKIHLDFAQSAVWTEYEARGTAAHPVLWQYVGDPDGGELCVLKKVR